MLFREIFLVVCSYVFPSLRGFLAVHLGIRARAYGAGTASGAHRDYGRKMRLRIHWILVSTAVVILAGCNAATEVSTHTIGRERKRTDDSLRNCYAFRLSIKIAAICSAFFRIRQVHHRERNRARLYKNMPPLSLSLSITPIKAFTASCRPVVFKSNRSEVSRCRTDARYPLPVPSRHFRPRFNFNFETNFGSTKRVSKVVVKHHLSVYTRVVVARRSIESDNRTKRSRIPIFAKSAHSRFTTFLRRK